MISTLAGYVPRTRTCNALAEEWKQSEYLGSNSKCKVVRGKELGWKPTKTTEDFYAFIPTEVEAIVKDPTKSRQF